MCTVWAVSHGIQIQREHIAYHMVTTRQAYDETIGAQNEVQNRQRLEARLRKQARELRLQVVAI